MSADVLFYPQAFHRTRTRARAMTGEKCFPEALETIPRGEHAGVAQDSFGQVDVRSEHANVQFRISGVQLPEGLSVPLRFC